MKLLHVCFHASFTPLKQAEGGALDPLLRIKLELWDLFVQVVKIHCSLAVEAGSGPVGRGTSPR